MTGLGVLVNPLRRVLEKLKSERNLRSPTAPQRMGADMLLTLPNTASEVRADRLIEFLSVPDDPKSCKVDLRTPPLNLHPTSLMIPRHGSKALG